MKMLRSAFRLAALAFVFVGLVSAAVPIENVLKSAGQPQPTRILFIGNSYTYYHNLPEMLEGMANSGPAGRVIETKLVAKPGWTLEQHWREGEALAAIRDGPWDYVVLQEQSTLGPTLVNGKTAISDPKYFHSSARAFDYAIKAAGAKTALMLTWARKAYPEQQAALTYAYMSLGKELGAKVVPIGLVWEGARKERAQLELFESDGSHPSPTGTYLAACTFYAALSGQSPAGVPDRVSGHPVNDAGIVSSGPAVDLVDVPVADAAWIKGAAWQTCERVRAAGGYILPMPPTRPVARELPAGQTPTISDLTGVWTGTLNLYGVPASIELRLGREADQWKAEWQADIGGSEKFTSVVANFQTGGAEIFFSVPDRRGGIVTEIYRGVFTGDSLVGTAELGGETRVHLYGSWELRKAAPK